MSRISTRFTDTYGVTHPIAQAGMAFVGMTPDLAVAVCEAGGLGSLGVGLMPPPVLKATIDGIRAGTDRPFNVNFVTGLTETPQIEVACVAVASFGSGGIVDGRGFAAALMLGADGAWVGTRLVATVESGAHPTYKARLVAAQGTDTVRTHVFGRQWPAEHDDGPVRVLRNEVVAQWHDRVGEIPRDVEALPVIGRVSMMGMDPQLRKFSMFVPMASTTGDLEEMPLLAGQGVGLVDSVGPAAEVIARMVTDAASAIWGARLRTD